VWMSFFSSRTALINQTRGLLAEYHIICAATIGKIRQQLPLIIEDAEQLLIHTARIFFSEMYDELQFLDGRVEQLNQQSKSLLKDNPNYQRIQQIPGIGPVIAATTLAAVGSGCQFRNGRQFAAWAGLAPRHYASGNSCRIGSISKHGNSSLRHLLIHGARTVMNWSQRKHDILSRWIQSLLVTKPACKVIVALANKLARMLWAVLAKKKDYSPV